MNGPYSGARTGTLGLLLTQDTAEDRVCRAYEAERGRIYRYLVSLGVGPPEAQELTQDVFVEFYRATKKGDEIQSPRGWLLTVASHRALNFFRDENCRPIAHATADENALEGMPTTDLSPELALLGRERLSVLRDAIRALPLQQQVCVRLRAEGLRYRAIAEILGLKVPTVAEHLRRALTRLRKVIHG